MKRALLLAAIVLLPVAVAVFLWSRPAPNPSPEEGRAIAEAFLARIGAGDVREAWDSTTAEFKSAEGQATFQARVAANAWLAKPVAFSSVQRVEVNGVERFEFSFTSTANGKFVRILLARDPRDWKVDRMTL